MNGLFLPLITHLFMDSIKYIIIELTFEIRNSLFDIQYSPFSQTHPFRPKFVFRLSGIIIFAKIIDPWAL